MQKPIERACVAARESGAVAGPPAIWSSHEYIDQDGPRLIGQLKPAPAEGYAVSTLPLPPAQTTGGLPLMQALQQRSRNANSTRAAAVADVVEPVWATAGVNRPNSAGAPRPAR